MACSRTLGQNEIPCYPCCKKKKLAADLLANHGGSTAIHIYIDGDAEYGYKHKRAYESESSL